MSYKKIIGALCVATILYAPPPKPPKKILALDPKKLQQATEDLQKNALPYLARKFSSSSPGPSSPMDSSPIGTARSLAFSSMRSLRSGDPASPTAEDQQSPGKQQLLSQVKLEPVDGAQKQQVPWTGGKKPLPGGKNPPS